MSLKHDPSAIRYASTQEAYGTTWILDKVEDDGAQVWKNSQGQEAIVQKACDQVRQNHREYRFNTDDKDYGIDRINKRIERFYTIERELGTPYSLATIAERYNLKAPSDLGHFQVDSPYLKEYCQADCEITQKLFEHGFFVNWNKVDQIQTAGDSLGTMAEVNAYDSRIKAAIQAKTGPLPASISNATINNLMTAAGYSSKSKDLDMPRPDPPYTNEIHFTPSVSKYTPAPGSYVGERKISPAGVTREWNGTRWVEVNKAGDRKISKNGLMEWEHNGVRWKRVR